MAPSELDNLEAVTIQGINRVDLYHRNGTEYYQGSALCRAMVIAPVPETNRRMLMIYKRPDDEPNSDNCQEIPLGEKISIEQQGKNLRLRVNEFEFNITPNNDRQLQVSRKSFASKDANSFAEEVNRYISQCLRDAS
jgi:hypothetical protein